MLGNGTYTNTGCKKGAVTYLEKFLGKPLQRFVCLLHANELPLRAAFNVHIRKTKGPDSHEGSISKEIHDHDLTDHPIETFQRIRTDFSECNEEIHKDLLKHWSLAPL